MSSHFDVILNKIVSVAEAKERIAGYKAAGETVVFTNGCFDILHEGHVTYLAKAADLGQRLVLALNTDASVKRQNKGPERPINNEHSRALVLAGLSFIDSIVFFDEDTPIRTIEALAPTGVVKGGDYDASESDSTSKKYIVGKAEVETYGGWVKTIPLVEGFSTTAVIEKLNRKGE